MARLQYHALIFLLASLVFATLQFFNHQTLVDNHHHSITIFYPHGNSNGRNNHHPHPHKDIPTRTSNIHGTHTIRRTIPMPVHDNPYAPHTTDSLLDVSPNRLIPSSRIGPNRIPHCLPEGMMDELSYAVLQKIRRGIIENQNKMTIQANSEENRRRQEEGSSPKLLCMVYTHEGSHNTYLRAIVDTWAKQCDGFLAVSNVTDVSLGAIRLEFPGGESYSNMWQKVQAMWKYVHDHYVEDFDYFHISGDDTYMIPDNFRMFFNSEQVQNLLNGHMDEFSKIDSKAKRWKRLRPRPLLLGTPVHYMNNGYHAFAAGGSGYTLNREAVKILYRLLQEDALNMTHATDSREDVIVSKYFEQVGITCSDTRDDSGAFRYVQDNPIRDYRDSEGDVRRKRKLHPSVNVNILDGFDAYSKETVAMHVNYKIGVRWFSHHIQYTEEMIYIYHDLLSGKCDDILLFREPNRTRIKHIAMTQQKKWFGHRKEAAVLEQSLGFPSKFLSQKENL